ncbi:MAG: serine hydrolase domain-containing protein [Chthoniobacterales bacterium]
MYKVAVRKLTLSAVLALCFQTVLLAQAAQRAQSAPPAMGQSPGAVSQPGQLLIQQGSGGPVKRMLGPGGPPEPFPEAKAMAQPKNDVELAGAIRKLGDTLAAKGLFSGSILLAADGKTLVDNAWGEANREAGTRNTTGTAYDVGSIGKLFTQLAIMQLAETGKLALDDTIAKYLPDYPNKAVADKVTIREILLHTSGIPDFFDSVTPETARSMKLESIVDLKDFLPLFAEKPLDFEPGSTNRYSNSGYIVLGLVIEAVGRENYRDYIQRHILEPAGMTHSGILRPRPFALVRGP